MILPPKVHFYEPKISGFNIVGKRGSHYFDPPKGATKFIQDSMQANLIEDTQKDEREIDMKSLQQDVTKMHIRESVEGEDKEATIFEGGRKGGRKRNRK